MAKDVYGSLHFCISRASSLCTAGLFLGLSVQVFILSCEHFEILPVPLAPMVSWLPSCTHQVGFIERVSLWTRQFMLYHHVACPGSCPPHPHLHSLSWPHDKSASFFFPSRVDCIRRGDWCINVVARAFQLLLALSGRPLLPPLGGTTLSPPCNGPARVALSWLGQRLQTRLLF